MKANFLCCMLVYILGCRVIADLIHKTVNETQQINLRCRPPVEDEVTWSVERNGSKLDILTVNGDKIKNRNKQSNKIYDGLADNSLTILQAEISDSGKYFCNSKEAVNLTVIPTGTKIKELKEGRNTSLNCAHIGVRSQETTWTREVAGKSEPIRFPAVGKKLKIRNVQLNDVGLYYCGGKLEVYLNVTKNKKQDGDKATQSSSTAKTTAKIITSTSAMAHSSANTPFGQAIAKHWFIGLAAGVGVLILMASIFFIRRYRLRKQGGKDQNHVYDEVQENTELQPTRGVQDSTELTPLYSLATFPGRINLDDPVYSIIPDLPQSKTELIHRS